MFLFFDNFDATVKRNSAKIIAVPNFHDLHVLLLQSCIWNDVSKRDRELMKIRL